MNIFEISGKKVLVDSSCAKYLEEGPKCHCTRRGRSFYVRRRIPIGNGKHKNEWLHRLVTCCPEGQRVDHINGDPLDNRRSNLRICDHAENMRNRRRHINNRSGLKGVYMSSEPRKKPWRAQITVDGKQRTIGSYATKEAAHAAYIREASRLHKDFARAN